MSNLSRSEIIENLAEFRKSANTLANNTFNIAEQFCNLIDKMALQPENFSQDSILIVQNILALLEKSNNDVMSYGEATISYYTPAIQNISKL